MIGLGLNLLASAIQNANKEHGIRDFRRNSETAYAKIDPVVIPENVNFKLKFKVITNDTGTAQMVFSNAISSNNCIFISYSEIHVRDRTGLTITTAGANYEHNLIHEITIERTRNTTLSIEIDGRNVGEGETSGSFIFDQLYMRKSTEYPCKGSIFDVQLSVEGDYILDMPITKYLPNPKIIENKAKPLGENIVVNGDFSSGLSDWNVDIGNVIEYQGGVKLVTDHRTIATIKQEYSFESGKYLLIFDVLNADAGTKVYNYCASESTNLGLIGKGGTYTVLFTGTSVRGIDLRISGAAGSTAVVSNVQIQKATGWGQYINPLEKDWDGNPFTLQANGDWWGSELWDDAAVWPVTLGDGIATYTNEVAHINSGPKGDYAAVRINNALIVGNRYRLTGVVFDVEASANGHIIIGETGNLGRLVAFNEGGKFSADFIADTTYLQVKRDYGSYTNLKIKDLHCLEVLKSA